MKHLAVTTTEMSKMRQASLEFLAKFAIFAFPVAKFISLPISIRNVFTKALYEFVRNKNVWEVLDDFEMVIQKTFLNHNFCFDKR